MSRVQIILKEKKVINGKIQDPGFIMVDGELQYGVKAADVDVAIQLNKVRAVPGETEEPVKARRTRKKEGMEMPATEKTL